MQTQLTVATLLVLCTAVPAALAQEYPVESQLKYQVWNGSEWTDSVVARPGGTVEMRVVVSYTGPGAVRGLGKVLYQPIFSNWDNEGPSVDNIGAWRNGGVGSTHILQGLLSEAEGQSGAPLSTYGRVGYGAIGSFSSGYNVLTSFRHSGGSNGAPDGGWLRMAGSFCSQWPAEGDSTNWSVDDANRVVRGVSASQWSEFVSSYPDGVNPFWRAGSTDVVVFRQAVLLSDQSNGRVIEITSEQSSLDRVGRPGRPDELDNRRFMTWHITSADSALSGDLRTGVAIMSAQIIVMPNIPAPAAAAVMLLGAAVVTRRRRA